MGTVAQNQRERSKNKSPQLLCSQPKVDVAISNVVITFERASLYIYTAHTLQMATVLSDSVKDVMSQYTFETDSINENLTCTLCSKLTMDAYETYCGCIYSQECMVEYLRDTEKYCRGNKSACKEEQLELEKNVFRSGILNRKILKMKVHCPKKICRSITDFAGMDEHLRVCNRPSIDCPYAMIGCDNDGISEDRIMTHLHDDALMHSKLMMELIHNLKNEVNGLKDALEMSKIEIASLGEKSEIKKAQNDDQQKEINDLRKVVESLKGTPKIKEDISISFAPTNVEISAMMDKIKKEFCTKVMTFTVDGLRVRARDSRKVNSPYFYSHAEGYKLKLEVYPGGCGFGRGKSLAIMFVICKGEYDDILSWPCTWFINISLINHNTGEKHYSSTYDLSTIDGTYKHVFDKPIKGDNQGYGYHTNMFYESLEDTPGVIVNDAIIIRCDVSPL